MPSISVITSAIKSFPQESAKFIKDPRVLAICALAAAILISLGISLAFLKQISLNAGIGIGVTGAFSGGIFLAGLFANLWSARQVAILPLVVPPGSGQIQRNENSLVPTLKNLCIELLIKHPALTQGRVKEIPCDLLEGVLAKITIPSQAKENAHLFSGACIEERPTPSSGKIQMVKITEEFDNPFVEVILQAFFEKGSHYFLATPQLSTRSLKGFCQFIKNVESSQKRPVIILNDQTTESFFSDLSNEEIKIFYENLHFESDNYILFTAGLAKISKPKTLENLGERIEKIFSITEIMRDHFTKTISNKKDTDFKKRYKTVEDFEEIAKVLNVITRCTFWARHFYHLSIDIESKNPLHRRGFGYANIGSYIKVQEVGVTVSFYMERTTTKLFSAMHEKDVEDED